MDKVDLTCNGLTPEDLQRVSRLVKENFGKIHHIVPLEYPAFAKYYRKMEIEINLKQQGLSNSQIKKLIKIWELHNDK
jgi:hypothetical protein